MRESRTSGSVGGGGEQSPSPTRRNSFNGHRSVLGRASPEPQRRSHERALTVDSNDEWPVHVSGARHERHERQNGKNGNDRGGRTSVWCSS